MSQKIKIKSYNRTKQSINLDIFYLCAETILHNLNLMGIVEIDLTLCGRKYIQKLNNEYRHIDKPTDVLSFPLVQITKGNLKQSQPINLPLHLGDIVICYDIAKTQAKRNNRQAEEELVFLFQHGLKHLLGFHHR